MQDIDMDTAFCEIYELNADEYESVSVITLPFSVRIINRFKENGIKTVAELLRTTPSTLMKMRGFGAHCLNEINAFCATLIEEDNILTVHDEKPSSDVIALFSKHHVEMAVGDFSAFDKMDLSEKEAEMLRRYKQAYEILGEELVFESVGFSDKVIPIMDMFADYRSYYKKQMEIRELVNLLPNFRKNNKAWGYINAFTLNEKERSILKGACDSEDTSLLSMAKTDKVKDESTFVVLKSFFKWCTFDLEKEISVLFEKLYSNERYRTIIQLRAQRQTLEQVGGRLGVTRERIRQIEAKAKRIFARLHSRIRIISKIAAERNGDVILTPAEIEEYCGEYTSDLLYFLQSYESSNYTYDRQLDVFVIGDDSLKSRVQNSIENLPEIIKVNQRNSMLNEAAEEADVPLEMLEKAFEDAYQLTGEVYHRYRLSLATIYKQVLETYYPHGFRAYDADEIGRFREIIANEYGDVGLPVNDHALTTRVTSICILCGKGIYRQKKKDYLPQQLADKICDYIENSENTIFMTNTLFSVFEEELLAAGIDNKYFLQGVLHELFAEKFVFRRDYVSKDPEVTSVYSSVVEFIRKSNYPVSKAQIQQAFPGITDIVINLSVSDPNVLNYFGEYLHASKLNILDEETFYLFNAVKELIADGEAHNIRELYEVISRQKPEIMTRNAAMYPFSVFSVIEFLFRERFQFSRPYIAKKGVEIGRPAERLHDLIYSCDEFALSDIREFEKENHFQIYSLLDYVNSCNDEFLLINGNTMMRINQTGIDESIAYQVENIIFDAITETTPVKNLSIWAQLPTVKVPWTDWLIYSVVLKWGTKLLAATSSNQFRLSIPLVAPADNFDPTAFRDGDKNDDPVSFVADDLSDMDSLLEDIIDFSFLEDEI